jgi:ABC-2 type transport system ATP-binding protein
VTVDPRLAIEAQGLTKKYDELVAVDNIDLEVYQGEVFGFLGPNGAGKTTTISMFTTLLQPSGGSARVGGHDVVTEGPAVRSKIGIVFQEQTLDQRLTATENLEFHAVLYNIPREQRRRRIADALGLVDLSDRADDLVERFSGGMRRRLEIARGLLHTPRILFLDEPTLGLDPQTRRSLWDHIRQLRETTDVTIFMTTHYMDEAEFCDRIAIIDHALIVALDTPEGLKHMVGGDVITLGTEDTEELGHYLAERGLTPEQRNTSIRVEVDDGARFIPTVARGFDGRIDSIELRRPTLDDVFLKLTGRTIRETELGQEDVAKARMRQRVRYMRGRR